MAGRGPQTFKKRQKEQQRKEKQEEKRAKRTQRESGGLPGIEPADINEDLDVLSIEDLVVESDEQPGASSN